MTSSDNPDPGSFGIGLRISLHPHCDDFVQVIESALDDVRAAGLTDGLIIETGLVDTWIGATEAPAEQRLADVVLGLLLAADRHTGGGHVVATLLLSRGCPGEVSCELPGGVLPTSAPVQLASAGVPARASWSLYPLLDGGSDAGQHLPIIETQIAAARRRGLVAGAAHYATPLAGDLVDVLTVIIDTWATVGSTVPHVVSHAVVSLGSPSISDETGAAA